MPPSQNQTLSFVKLFASPARLRQAAGAILPPVAAAAFGWTEAGATEPAGAGQLRAGSSLFVPYSISATT